MELRPYQKEDVKRSLQTDSIALFNEQRTGKTPTICTILKEKQPKRTMIVCPASLLYVWKREFELWTGQPAFVVPDTKFKDFEWDKYNTILVNFEKLRGNSKSTPLLDVLIKQKLDAIVVDEAHRMKNKDSLTAVALRKLRKTKIKIAATGTPAPSKPWDVWTILNWLYPQTFSSYWKFVEEYFMMDTTYVYGERHSTPCGFKPGYDTLLAQNLDIYCIQRKRKDVMQWADTLEQPTIVELPCTTTQLKALDGLMNYFEYKHIITQTILDNLVRVRQVCAAPEILGIRGRSPKLAWLQDYLIDYPEKSVIVFSNSKKFLILIQEKLNKLFNLGLITGDTLPKDRANIIYSFQNKQIQCLLLQTQAGKEGLTLDQADTTVFLDTYPPIADYLQAKDRMIATTENKVKPKEIIHVIMKDTYDAELFRMVSERIAVNDIINDYKKYIKKGE